MTEHSSEAEAAQYGFRWGPMDVIRIAHIEGRGYCLEIRTDYDRLQVYVSEKGRKVEAVEMAPQEPWACIECGTATDRYDNGEACETCVLTSFAENG